MDKYSRAVLFCSVLLCLFPTAAVSAILDVPELQVSPSPTQACSIQLDGVEKVVDYDVAPDGPNVAAIVKDKVGDHGLVFWQIGSKETTPFWKAPADFVPRAIAWHPRGKCLFVMGCQRTNYQVMRLDKGTGGWNAATIFTSPDELRRLVVGPSPFIPFVIEDESKDREERYRLFIGMKNQDGKTFRIVSITEEGKRFYQVIGPSKTFTHFKGVEHPSKLESASALPMVFHRSGDELIWEDGQHQFHCARYTKYWDEKTDLLRGGC